MLLEMLRLLWVGDIIAIQQSTSCSVDVIMIVWLSEYWFRLLTDLMMIWKSL